MSHTPAGHGGHGGGHGAESGFLPEPVENMVAPIYAGKIIGSIVSVGALEHLFDSFGTAIFSGGHGGGGGHAGHAPAHHAH